MIHLVWMACTPSDGYQAQFSRGFPDGSTVKNLPVSAGGAGLIPTSGRFPWRKKWQPTPVFLSGKSHRQWSLVGYSPWGR